MTAADKVRARIYEAAGGCWIWLGARTWKGYGRVYWEGRAHYTHRVMFEETRGPIPPDKQIDHLCRRTSCCNPAHLELVTSAENTRRGRSVEASKSRRERASECQRGHAFTPENTYVDSRGYRSCKECRRIKNQAWTQVRKGRRYRTFTAQGGNVASIARAKNG